MANRRQKGSQMPPDAFLRRVVSKREREQLMDDDARMARLEQLAPGPVLSASDLDDLSRDDLLVLLKARAVLDRQKGKKTGPTTSVKPPAQKGSKPSPPPRGSGSWAKVKRTCPKCGHTGPVDPDFGVKVVRDVERPQSWCRSCRAGTNYHNRPRKYQIKI